MEIITINENNIDQEHICCAISEKKGEHCAATKKEWMKARFKEGLVFKRLDARGKVMIEYIPAENAWYPIDANGYMHINCFWVSGQYKGQGYANKLLEECISDAKSRGKQGITVISSSKKMPFLSDPKYLKYKGFKAADTASPYYELLYLPFSEDAPIPHFKTCAKNGLITDKGWVLYYTNQCPHAEKYALLIAKIARQNGQSMHLNKILTTEEAQNAPAPMTTYSLFYNGQFITNEILSEKKFINMLSESK